MPSTLWKPFRKPVLLGLYTFLVGAGYLLWRRFTDTEVMFGNYGALYTYTDITLSALIIILFPLFIIGVIYK